LVVCELALSGFELPSVAVAIHTAAFFGFGVFELLGDFGAEGITALAPKHTHNQLRPDLRSPRDSPLHTGQLAQVTTIECPHLLRIEPLKAHIILTPDLRPGRALPLLLHVLRPLDLPHEARHGVVEVGLQPVELLGDVVAEVG
jgi:hypothetical protein